jgi:proteasome lid subunit RPN8/RPN11
MELDEVVIYRKVLEQFKRRALRKYPKEYARALWGTVDDGIAYICMTAPVVVHDVDENSITFEPDEGSFGEPIEGEVLLLGTIHTHPEGDPRPSEEDIKDAQDEKEMFFGICSIQNGAHNRYIGFNFFTPQGQLLPLSVAE